MITRETNCEVIVRDQNDPDALKASIADSLLLTNATNVGMEEDSRSLVPPEFLRKDLLVSDIIYHPEMTTLLKDAKEAGARYMNGKYMLLFQGAAAFQIWTGEKMPISYIKETCFS
jgi:shikimate dehydrogenase